MFLIDIAIVCIISIVFIVHGQSFVWISQVELYVVWRSWNSLYPESVAFVANLGSMQHGLFSETKNKDYNKIK